MDAFGFIEDLAALGVTRFAGVPDSLLAPLITALGPRIEMTADEGAAVGLAIGHHLGSGAAAAVVMQNSGLGNAVNPLTSLAHREVYGIPMLLIIGWRGAGHDEPQHVFQGRITPAMLDLLEIPHAVIGPETARAAARAEAARLLALGRPVALVVREGAFAKVPAPKARSNAPSREAAIAAARAALPGVPVVATTGKIGRELYALRTGAAEFLTVGGMGHAVMIATGLAQARPGTKVACFDGDGAVLMHAGSLANAARCDGLIHLVFNNRCHDSVGGQVTNAPGADLCALARALGYAQACHVATLDAIAPALRRALAAKAASFIEIEVAPGARADLGRPQETPQAAKAAFMEALRHDI
jgi:phosphonopyruvate decarboxylase